MDIGQAITSATVPIRAVIAGSPVLARRLRAPATKRRTAAAEIRQVEAEALAAELAKLNPKARAAKQAEQLAADRAGRKERRSRAADIASCTALVLLVAGPVGWQFARPYLGTAALVLAVAWSIAAMAHAPSARKATPEPAPDETPIADPDDTDEWIQDSPPEAVLWALIRHTAALTKQGTAAHLQAVLVEARKRGEMTDWTVADLAEELASYGVPVVEGKKLTVGGRDRNRKAVLLSVLPEADPAPFPVLVQPAASSAA
jgi:hypothetical protein